MTTKISLAVLYVVLLVGLFLGFQQLDPLVRQERIARSGLVVQTTFETRNDNDYYWNAQQLEAILTLELGVTVVYERLPDSMMGVSVPAVRRISINEDLAWSARFEVLAHEAGHMLSPYLASRSEGEVFAEAVAVIVCVRAGDRSIVGRSGRYLRQHRGALHVLKEYANDIDRAANFLSGSQ